jgi:RNA polymerase sigma factor (sigma-70 family)
MKRYVARRVRNPEATIEIMSQIWEATYVRFEKKPPPRNWNELVWGIARNKVADWGRSRNKTPDPIYMDLDDLERVAGEVVDKPDLGEAEELQRLRRTLKHTLAHDLTALQREAVILRYVDELTYPEIASLMKVSRSVAKKHVERGIVNARKSMVKAGFLVQVKEAK